jgi:RNA polymerase sigma-70 factor (ECF subfamily)
MRSDESLYEQLIGGDLAAFDALYERYERPLFGFIRRHVRDPAEAEEIFHEAFLALLREREQRRAVTSFRAWIYRVARNLCLNRLRSQRRADRAIARLAVEPAVDDAGPEASLVGREAHQRLQRAVSRLPEPLGELYALRAAGLSYEGLAEVLGVPIGTVKSRMNAMLTRLREEMAR